MKTYCLRPTAALGLLPAGCLYEGLLHWAYCLYVGQLPAGRPNACRKAYCLYEGLLPEAYYLRPTPLGLPPI
jgi:hypothetical protein